MLTEKINEFKYFADKGNAVWLGRTMNCYIHATAQVADSAIIFPFVYIGPSVQIGENVVVGPGASIGAPGFGYNPKQDGTWEYRAHPFGVEIGDDVHIGANACIDAGRHRTTKIGRGTKIDNLVHIAHNVEVGEDCLIIALSQLSGTVEVGDHAMVSPSATVRDHIKIGDGAHVGLGACVVKDVPAGQTWAGVPARRLT